MENGGPKRAVYMSDGRILRGTHSDVDEMAFTYSIPAGGDELTGYMSSVALREGRKGTCIVTAQCSIPRTRIQDY